MSTEKNEGDDPPFLCEIPYGVLVALLSPFALLLALALSVDGGLVYATRADLLWAMHNASAGSGGPTPTLTDSTVITLRRSICFGACPEYTLKLTGTGKVEYEGRSHVCVFGAHTALADPREVSHVVRAMVAMGYFGYSWQKGDFWSDMPTVTTSLQHEGRRYELVHDHGDDGAPEWLGRMENEIDRVAGTQRWLPVLGTDWKRRCPSSVGGARESTMHEQASDGAH